MLFLRTWKIFYLGHFYKTMKECSKTNLMKIRKVRVGSFRYRCRKVNEYDRYNHKSSTTFMLFYFFNIYTHSDSSQFWPLGRLPSNRTCTVQPRSTSTFTQPWEQVEFFKEQLGANSSAEWARTVIGWSELVLEWRVPTSCLYFNNHACWLSHGWEIPAAELRVDENLDLRENFKYSDVFDRHFVSWLCESAKGPRPDDTVIDC